MALTEYRRKRDFSKTAEPRGSKPRSRRTLSFVVQKHDASHLHYDFRLELDGVLKSWAVPKGPDLDPSVKRLAMQVEDHPLEYGSFEGTIPEGEYGGGTVLLWDQGTWEPLEDAHQGLREGHLKFTLHGEKLKGNWMLVRKGGRNAPEERAWFLFKERDKFAKQGRPLTERMPLSVTTGRDLDEIAAAADRVWGPKGEMSRNGHTKTRSKKTEPEKATPKRSTPKKAGPKKATSAKSTTRQKMAARSADEDTRKRSALRAADSRAQAVSSKSTRPRKAQASSSDQPSEVAGVTLSHPDKILYPDQGFTKRDLAAYYEQVAEWMLPQVSGRVLALVRCPGGSGKPCFFQKHPGEGASKNLVQVNVAESGSPEYHLAIKNLAGLISLVQMGVLEIHVWGSKIATLEKPDRLIFDLDPDPSVDWPRVVTAAREVRLVLEELGLKSFLKTTGGKGLHVVVPVRPTKTWDEAKAFCRTIAELMVRVAPDRYIAKMSKAARKGKIFVDYLRNGRGATAIAAYSTRARAGATVSAPISWDELSPKLTSDHFNIANLPARLERLDVDPWSELSSTKQSITAAMLKQLVELQL